MSKAGVLINELRDNLEYAKKNAADSNYWHRDVLQFDSWNKPNKGTGKGSSVKYIQLDFTPIIGGKTGKIRLNKIIVDHPEIHNGIIAPLTAEEAAKMTEMLNFDQPIKPREFDATINIRRFRSNVETEDDGITIKTDSKGEQILPDDSERSATFRVLELLSEAFANEFNYQRKKGTVYVDDVDAMVKGALKITAGKRNVPVQLAIKKGPKEGELLSNPIARMKIMTDSESGQVITKFMDARTEKIGKDRIKRYEPLLVDGKPIDVNNIHKAITTKTVVKAANFKVYVSISGFGVSLTTKLTSAIIQPYEYKKDETLEDEYGSLLVATDEEIEKIGVTEDETDETGDAQPNSFAQAGPADDLAIDLGVLDNLDGE